MADLGVNSSLFGDYLSPFSYGFLPLFYLVPPHHTYYKEISDVPPYVQKVYITVHAFKHQRKAYL